MRAESIERSVEHRAVVLTATLRRQIGGILRIHFGAICDFGRQHQHIVAGKCAVTVVLNFYKRLIFVIKRLFERYGVEAVTHRIELIYQQDIFRRFARNHQPRTFHAVAVGFRPLNCCALNKPRSHLLPNTFDVPIIFTRHHCAKFVISTTLDALLGVGGVVITYIGCIVILIHQCAIAVAINRLERALIRWVKQLVESHIVAISRRRHL